MTKKVIGVLALQGCVTPHRAHIEALGHEFLEVRTEKDLDAVDALIIPGGESTTMLKLIDTFNLENKLRETFKRVPVWGICAGAILIAKEVHSPDQKSFGLLDIAVERNSYGRQNESFNAVIENYPVSFIRAPKITSNAENVTVRATQDSDPVWVSSDHAMATTFHPELSTQVPSPMHEQFARMI